MIVDKFIVMPVPLPSSAHAVLDCLVLALGRKHPLKDLLFRRVRDQQTLQQIGAAHGICGERVRQTLVRFWYEKLTCPPLQPFWNACQDMTGASLVDAASVQDRLSPQFGWPPRSGDDPDETTAIAILFAHATGAKIRRDLDQYLLVPKHGVGAQ
ncbi:MAG: hypothetical protein H7338_22765 [Candidatus Sericytochromatia bacterium]|nr:hypothetical protein [Candidatus Sericytochromatia bacterium]